MKRSISTTLFVLALTSPIFAHTNGLPKEDNNKLLTTQTTNKKYVPIAENLAARKRFEGFRFGIFLHWGIYSTFATRRMVLKITKLTKTNMQRLHRLFIHHTLMPTRG